MKAALVSALALATRLGLPAAGDSPSLPRPEAALSLTGFVSVWRQDCAPSCGLPAPILADDPAALSLALPEKPGEFRAARLARAYAVDGETLKLKTEVYAVCPKPAPDCAGRFFTVQVELSGAAAAFCTATLNIADISPFPVMACAGPKGSQRIGVTLHRVRLGRP